MKKVFLFLSTIILQCVLFGQDGLKWGSSYGGANVDELRGIAADSEGNNYITGTFFLTVDFDPGADVFEVSSEGETDFFVLKLDSDGNFVWCKTFGGAGFDASFGLNCDFEDNIVLSGSFTQTVDFDPGPGVVELTSVDETEDAFILKLDADGNFLWVKSFGIAAPEFGNQVTTDISGNIYTTGKYFATVDFDPGPAVFNLSADGFDDPDIYILKLDSDGDFVWAATINGDEDETANAIHVDESGDVYLCGEFEGSPDFDPGVAVFSLTSESLFNGFVEKLDADGNFVWAYQIGMDDYASALTLLTDSDGNVYTSGYFFGTADFDPGAETLDYTSSGLQDVFIQKVDDSGNLIWARTFGNSMDQRGIALGIDESNEIYLTGRFVGTMDADPGAGEVNLSSNGGTDIFFQKWSSAGVHLWARSIGGADFDEGTEIFIDEENNLALAGHFNDEMDFNPGLMELELTSNGSADIFIIKVPQCETNETTDIITACNTYTWIDGETYTEDNSTATWILSNMGGCDSLVTLDLTVIDIDNGITQDGATLTADDPDASYQWLDCSDGYSEIPTETGASFTATEDGTYAVRVEQGECVDTSECITIEGVGLAQNNLNLITVYPNPSPGQVVISGMQMLDYEFIVFSISGEKILQKTIYGKELIDLQLPRGQYILRLIGAQETFNFSVVVTG